MTTKHCFILLITLLSATILKAQSFTEVNALSTLALTKAKAAAIDYNNDGYLDVFVNGTTNSSASGATAKLFKNNGNNTFSEQTAISLPGFYNGTFSWADYNNDGNIDLFLTGQNTAGVLISKLFKNTGANSFIEQTNISFVAATNASAAWADYDNDGFLDLVISGQSALGKCTKLYKNYGGINFAEQTQFSFQPSSPGSVSWEDYNKDGFIDLLVSGTVSKLYKNNGNNTFSEVTTSLVGGYFPNVSWGDYNNDNTIDIMINASTSPISNAFTKIYANAGTDSFAFQSSIVFPKYLNGSALWGDYDNDGDLDILLSGALSGFNNTKIYTNGGSNSFIENTTSGLPSLFSSSIWGDFDNDGDLDVLFVGENYIKLFRNNSNVINVKPSMPTGLTTQMLGNKIKLSWNKSIDSNLLNQHLSYNIRIGSSLGGIDLYSPQSLLSNGVRQIVKSGAIQDTFILIEAFNNLPACSSFYWAVQAIDQGYQGSDFSMPVMQANTWMINALPDTTIFPNDTIQLRIVNNSCNTSSYSWSPTNTLINPNSQNPLAHPSQPTTYFVSVTSNSVTHIDSVKVNVLTFKEITNLGLPQVSARFNWGDFDNDQDYDPLIFSNTSTAYSKLLKNNNNDTFIEQDLGVSLNTYGGNVQWVDYNSDNNLDFFVAGDQNGIAKSYLYKNLGNQTFIKDTASILFLKTNPSLVDFGDFDNDGDLDIISNGDLDNIPDGVESIQIYINEKDSFTILPGLNITELSKICVKWGDYDNDGLLDFIYTGTLDNYFVGLSQVYKNIGNGVFKAQQSIVLPSVTNGTVAWIDFNNDGKLDIFITGKDTLNNYITAIYKNLGNNSFQNQTSTGLLINFYANCSFGDFDNDGFTDILMQSKSPTYPYSKLYKNLGGFSFSEHTGINAPQYAGYNEFIDYNNDGSLDIMFSNYPSSTFLGSIKLYENLFVTPNLPPTVPSSLQFNPVNKMLSWNNSSDDHTPTQSVTYNLAIGKTTNQSDVMPAHANLSNGFRRINKMGNQQLDSFALLNLPFDSIYFAHVQAIDNAYKASAFSNPIQFVMPPVGFIPNDTAIYCGASKQLNVTITNGKASDLSYVWSPSIGLSSTSIANPIASPKQSTWYKVIATSTNGKIFSDSIHIIVNQIDLTIGSDTTLACGDSLILNPIINTVGSQTILSYQWSPSIGLDSSNIKNPVVKLQQNTNYHLTINASDGCIATDSISITSVPLQITVNNFALPCGDTLPIGASINSNNSNLSYSWSPKTGLSDTSLLNPMVSLAPSTYIIHAKNGQCLASDTVEIALGLSNYNVDFMASKLHFVDTPFTAQFTNNTPDLANYNFTWYFGDGTTLASNNLTLSHTYSDTGIYTVALKAESKVNTCMDSTIKFNYIHCQNDTIDGLFVEKENALELKVYPNPNQGNFTVSIENMQADAYSIEISSSLGSVIYSEDIISEGLSATKKIDLGAISKGIYYIRFFSEKSTTTKKIVIN